MSLGWTICPFDHRDVNKTVQSVISSSTLDLSLWKAASWKKPKLVTREGSDAQAVPGYGTHPHWVPGVGRQQSLSQQMPHGAEMSHTEPNRITTSK